MNFPFLPTLNAFLNGLCAVFLVTGFIFIKRGNRDAHKLFMISAFVVSCMFLVSYLYYHFTTVGLTRFDGKGGIRILYLSILISHSILAVINLPMVITTIIFALKRNYVKHKSLAPYTFWIWLYVSITGVIVYSMLYL